MAVTDGVAPVESCAPETATQESHVGLDRGGGGVITIQRKYLKMITRLPPFKIQLCLTTGVLVTLPTAQ